MQIRALKYLAVFTLPFTVAVSFSFTGWITFLPIIYAFGMVPFLELWVRPKAENLSTAEQELVKRDKTYDVLLYLMVPVQWAFVVWFFFALDQVGGDGISAAGRISGLGMLCGVVGINVAHELGHRPKKSERTMAKSLLLSSLYMHFFIEHNRGHHKHVATPDDPASARFGESVYVFWVRSLAGSWIHAWRLEKERLNRQGKSAFSWSNEMLRFQLIQVVLLAMVFLAFGGFALLAFFIAALIGALLLETVNYIEHYGLLRVKNERGRYGRVMPWHSWNSNHVMGRLLLFELTRHSDHHYKASKPYPLLDHMEEAPQLPTGYPGMMLLSLLPPVFFRIMNRKVQQLQMKHH